MLMHTYAQRIKIKNTNTHTIVNAITHAYSLTDEQTQILTIAQTLLKLLRENHSHTACKGKIQTCIHTEANNYTKI